MTTSFDTSPPSHESLRSAKQGLLPGTPVYIGDRVPSLPTIHVIVYSADRYEEKNFDYWNDCKAFLNTINHQATEEGPVLWLNVEGLGDTELLKAIGEHFQINALTIEDILNTHQRTKLDDYDHYLFVVMKMLEARKSNHSNLHPDKNRTDLSVTPSKLNSRLNIDYEQVSLILNKHFLITFLEDPGDVFDSIRTQLRENKGRIRKLGVDYLLYALIDAVVDHYFGVIEMIGEYLEQLSDSLLRYPTPTTLRTIHRLRQQTIRLRRVLWPLREVLGHLQRDESNFIQSGTKLYLRDVYDHGIEIIDTLETNRDILSSMAEMYLSSSSYQLNVIMKILTIMSTIFIPITFISSVYGMNFKYMPELDLPYAYPIVWCVMIIIAISMLVFFKRQHWLG